MLKGMCMCYTSRRYFHVALPRFAALTLPSSRASGAATGKATVNKGGPTPSHPIIYEVGVLEGIRTPDPRFRKPVLYPAELPRRVGALLNVFCVWVKLDLVGLGRIS